MRNVFTTPMNPRKDSEDHYQMYKFSLFWERITSNIPSNFFYHMETYILFYKDILYTTADT